jgi:2-polyprenyl-3-methyl-5-hydroxy-6-metoxy-1,4-benzoquinol methylase
MQYSNIDMSQKINNYISILNIPCDNGIDNFFDLSKNRDHNWYYYLFDFNNVSVDHYNKILNGESRLELDKHIYSYVNQITEDFQISSSKNQTIVDFGCGWGLLSFWLLQFPNKTVYAVGYRDQIEKIEKIYAIAVEKGFVHPSSKLITVSEPLTLNSIKLGIQIPSNGVDLVIMNDVIEHIHPSMYPNLVLACYNNLKNGGKVISKSHNTDNKSVITRLRSYWDQCEIDFLLDSRKKYIRGKNSNISDADIAKLAVHTKGYSMRMVDSAIKLFEQTAELMPVNNDLVPIDIKLDNYLLENYVSTSVFEKLFEFASFKVKSIPSISRSRKLKLFKLPIKLFPRTFLLIPFFSGVILITATKST